MSIPRIDVVARLVGDPSRAAMLDALMDGRAWTGRELARAAHIVPSTASEHLQRLVAGALVTVVAQGSHRYYRIASPDVAQALESLMFLAARAAPPTIAGPKIDVDLRRARMCYDHLAGALGVGVADALARRGAIVFGPDGATVTESGSAVFAARGLELDASNAHRPLCRACLDWSERRFHLAGRVGAALARRAFDRRWLIRKDGTRAVTVTEAGVAALRYEFAFEWIR